MTSGQLKKQQFESQVQLLQEQINTARASDTHLKARIEGIDKELAEKTVQKDRAQSERSDRKRELDEADAKEQAAAEALNAVQEQIAGAGSGGGTGERAGS